MRFRYLSRFAALLFFIVVCSRSALWYDFSQSIFSFFRDSSATCVEFKKFKEDYKPNDFADDWTGAVSLVLNDTRRLKKAILPEGIDCENFAAGSDFAYLRKRDFTARFSKAWFE
jgi:hypothetical protein